MTSIFFIVPNILGIPDKDSPVVSQIRRNFVNLCSAKYKSSVKHGGSILVIGGLSFIGSKVSMYFHNEGINVIPVEDQDKHVDERMAYRWQKLHEFKLDTKFIDLSDLESLFHSHNIGEVIYIPAGLFDGQKKINNYIAFKSLNVSGVLKNFIRLLELISNKYPLVRLSFISLPRKSNLSFQSAWLKTFEVSLTAYQQLYSLKATIIRFEGAYGPWQNKDNLDSCWYINDIIGILEHTLKNDSDCIEVDLVSSSSLPLDPARLETLTLTNQWEANYSKLLQKRKNYVMSTYFTDVESPQYSFTFLKNSYRFVQQWFESVLRIGAHAIIFHDSLTEDFQNRMKNLYSHVHFQKIDVEGRRPNDYRFYLYHQYLSLHPEIQNIVFTDIRDVIFLNDPFEIMRIIGDYIFMGVDVPFYENSWSNEVTQVILRRCHSKDSESKWVKLHPSYNAGVIGGTRHIMVSFLTKMIQYLDRTPHELNCNMGTITLVTHKHFNENSFSGYPFQSAFKIGLPGPHGLAIKHKIYTERLTI